MKILSPASMKCPRPRRASACLAPWLFALVLPLPAAGQRPAHAHSHGRATLDVAVEQTTLSIGFSTPLDNLVGFERAPRTEAERRVVDKALATLRAGGALFTIDPAAQCRFRQVELSSVALKLGEAGDAKVSDGHADLDARFDFTCVDASKAAHVDVGLFAFKRLRQLDVQVATPAGQFKQTLKPSVTRLLLSR